MTYAATSNEINATKSIPGTKIEVGMMMHRSWNCFLKVVGIENRQHPMGARYMIVTLENGEAVDAWEGFNYMVGIKA